MRHGDGRAEETCRLDCVRARHYCRALCTGNTGQDGVVLETHLVRTCE